MLKTAQDVKKDAYKKAVKPPTEASAAIIKNKRRKRIASFFRSLNPANWFDEFSDIKITLEEFGNIKKINQEGRSLRLNTESMNIPEKIKTIK